MRRFSVSVPFSPNPKKTFLARQTKVTKNNLAGEIRVGVAFLPRPSQLLLILSSKLKTKISSIGLLSSQVHFLPNLKLKCRRRLPIYPRKSQPHSHISICHQMKGLCNVWRVRTPALAWAGRNSFGRKKSWEMAMNFAELGRRLRGRMVVGSASLNRACVTCAYLLFAQENLAWNIRDRYAVRLRLWDMRIFRSISLERLQILHPYTQPEIGGNVGIESINSRGNKRNKLKFENLLQTMTDLPSDLATTLQTRRTRWHRPFSKAAKKCTSCKCDMPR